MSLDLSADISQYDDQVARPALPDRRQRHAERHVRCPIGPASGSPAPASMDRGNSVSSADNSENRDAVGAEHRGIRGAPFGDWRAGDGIPAQQAHAVDGQDGAAPRVPITTLDADLA